jgi:MOSC domain-containing protein YiiM
MGLESVNAAKARPRPGGGGETGIYKEPVTGVVEIGHEGVAGDSVCDARYHGGRDQAVYVYGSSDYDWWAARLGHALEPGTFGENLTISGVESARINVGDRLRVGPVVCLEVTAPRIPCGTLSGKMGDPSFARSFREAGRPGFYCRVLAAGPVEVGDRVSLEPADGETVSILEVFEDYYTDHSDEAALRRILAAPIAIRDRRQKEKQLAELVARSARPA